MRVNLVTLWMRHACWVVVFAVAGSLACSSNGANRDSQPAPPTETPSTISTTSERTRGGLGTTTNTPPPLSAVETVVIDALATLAIEAHRDELGTTTSASIGADLGDRRRLQVLTYAVGTNRGEFTVRNERLIADVPVRTLEYSSGVVREAFDCDGLTHEVAGSVPDGFVDFDAFLAAFIAALGCGT